MFDNWALSKVKLRNISVISISSILDVMLDQL